MHFHSKLRRRQLFQGVGLLPAQVAVPALAQPGKPVIATQVVPLVNASLPVVRTYRETLGRLLDEPPVLLSLAGFIAARYTHDLSGINGPLTRQTALAEFQRRADVDVGGFRISYDAQRRSANYVTQSTTTADDRLVG